MWLIDMANTDTQFQSDAYPYATAPVDTDLLKNITWRYDQSPNLVALIASKQKWYEKNHDQFWNDWIANVFDLRNANNLGLAVWAYILNVPISVLALQDSFRYWAFDALRENFTDSTKPQNPGSGDFPPVSSSGAITTLQEKIWALRLKYYVHTSQRTVTSLNAMLADVFSNASGTAYVLDNQNMTMTYVFNFAISTFLQNAMIQYDLLPRVAGVKLIIQVNP